MWYTAGSKSDTLQGPKVINSRVQKWYTARSKSDTLQGPKVIHCRVQKGPEICLIQLTAVQEWRYICHLALRSYVVTVTIWQIYLPSYFRAGVAQKPRKYTEPYIHVFPLGLYFSFANGRIGSAFDFRSARRPTAHWTIQNTSPAVCVCVCVFANFSPLTHPTCS